jgi:hypothetical protein
MNEVEERTLHRMAKVHYFLEMWQGSQNLCATQKDSRTQNRQMAAIGYILDSEETVIASWSLSQYDSVATFKLSERSPLPPAWSAKDFPGRRTPIRNVCQLQTINHHPVECDEDSTPARILDTDNCLHRNGNLDNSNNSEDNCTADDESDTE